MNQKVLTEKQIADAFQVSTRTVQRWVQRGCPCRTAPGLKRKRLFHLDLVSTWLYEAGEPIQITPDEVIDCPEPFTAGGVRFIPPKEGEQ
jgi:phage terminase Nu1 subunit (DNA packaging protein)